MNEEVQAYINKYPKKIIELYTKLRTLIYSSTSQEIEENYGLNYQATMLEILL